MVQYVLYKKPINLFIGFLFLMGLCKAQQPLNASYLLRQNDLARAKESIDSFVLANEHNAEGWLLKAAIYNAISKDADAKTLVPDSRMDAFTALQKAMQWNSIYTDTNLKASNYSLPFDLYHGYTNEGIAYFNTAAERNDKIIYAAALNKFKKAGDLSKYIFSNGWGLAVIDTSNLYYCAKAAINAGKDEDALLYARQIADAGIKGSGYEPVYQWLAFYYKQQKNGELLNKYAQQGIQYFPTSVYFNLVLIDWLRQQDEYGQLFSNYETVFKKLPANTAYQLAYFNDVYNYLYQSKVAVSNRAAYENKLSTGLQQYIKNNPAKNSGARLLLAKLYINQADDIMKESLLRSATDTKLMNGYKTTRINLLVKSNGQLKQLVNAGSKVLGKADYEEVRRLLSANNIMLKQLKQ